MNFLPEFSKNQDLTGTDLSPTLLIRFGKFQRVYRFGFTKFFSNILLVWGVWWCPVAGSFVWFCGGAYRFLENSTAC